MRAVGGRYDKTRRQVWTMRGRGFNGNTEMRCGVQRKERVSRKRGTGECPRSCCAKQKILAWEIASYTSTRIDSASPFIAVDEMIYRSVLLVC